MSRINPPSFFKLIKCLIFIWQALMVRGRMNLGGDYLCHNGHTLRGENADGLLRPDFNASSVLFRCKYSHNKIAGKFLFPLKPCRLPASRP
jgi:hypothetical protein